MDEDVAALGCLTAVLIIGFISFCIWIGVKTDHIESKLNKIDYRAIAAVVTDEE
jgi:hypothetical protein